jgi:hypothetical protein
MSDERNGAFDDLFPEISLSSALRRVAKHTWATAGIFKSLGVLPSMPELKLVRTVARSVRSALNFRSRQRRLRRHGSAQVTFTTPLD